MRLYRGKIPVISDEVTQLLINDGCIEVDPANVAEVSLDVKSVLDEYARVDYEILEKAKDIVSTRRMDYGQLTRVREGLARERHFGINDEAYEWIIRQMIEVLMYSKNVEEIYAEDSELRRRIRDVLRKHTNLDDELDRQVKARIKNLQEGTTDFEIEYQRVLGDLRQQKRLT